MHRPYARSAPEPSVTTVLGLLDKPGLARAAAREVALRAVETLEWRSQSPGAAVQALKSWPFHVWDGKAALGTLVHEVAEGWAHGETVDLQAKVDVLQKSGFWAGRGDELGEIATALLDALEDFWLNMKPVENVTEVVVRTPGKYIGTLDWRCKLNIPGCEGERWTLDIKTQAADEDRLYLDTWALQLHAYDFAQQIVRYDNREIVDVSPNEGSDRLGIVLLRPGAWSLISIDRDVNVFLAFARLCDVWHWRKAYQENTDHWRYVAGSNMEKEGGTNE